MTDMLESPGVEAGLYLESPILTQQAALAKFDAWQAGHRVASELTPVGFIEPSEDELLLLESRRLLRTEYRKLPDDSPLLAATARLRSAFMSLVMADVVRGGLEGNLRTATWSGHYRNLHREMLHSDNYRHPSVRWTAAWGIGSTVAAEGPISRQDILSVGDLNPGVEVGSGCQLEIETHAPGTVLRFMNVADIHGGPDGEGARIMVQATLHLDH